MRMLALVFILLAVSAPAFAQTTSGAASSVNVSNPAYTSSNATTRLITPPTVVAPGLAAAGIETCLGSASGGVSVMGTGLTFGKTTPDEGCNIRLAARQLAAFGYARAALALMCQDPHVAEAMATVGQACPYGEVEQVSAIPPPPPVHLLPARKKKKVASRPVAQRKVASAASAAIVPGAVVPPPAEAFTARR